MNTLPLKNIIAISGQISSGKSYLANIFSEKLGFPVASFGSYLKYYSEQNNLPIDRKSLQDLGESFIKQNPQKFLNDVINYFISQSDSIIIEVIRHKVIFDLIHQISKKCLFVFVAADGITRYKRYRNRNKPTDKIKTYKQFVGSENHEVESEINSLQALSDIVVDSTKDYSLELLNFISEKVK